MKAEAAWSPHGGKRPPSAWGWSPKVAKGFTHPPRSRIAPFGSCATSSRQSVASCRRSGKALAKQARKARFVKGSNGPLTSGRGPVPPGHV
jgi:hypothetical protein